MMTEQEKQARAMGGETIELRLQQAEAALRLAMERNAALREAVRPFVELHDLCAYSSYWSDVLAQMGGHVLTDLRRLAAAAKDGA